MEQLAFQGRRSLALSAFGRKKAFSEELPRLAGRLAVWTVLRHPVHLER